MLRGMVPDPELRAGDADRDRTITLIREAYAEGRLGPDEFDARMSAAQESRTYGQLAELVKDLPVQAPTAPVPAIQATAPAVVEEQDEERSIRSGWAAWAGVSLLVNVIWGASWMSEGGSPPYYWPIWVMGPWGAAMLIGTLSRRNR